MITQTKFLNTNALVYLPTGYVPTKAYPCMIFHPGAGEMGVGHTAISLLSSHGPFQYLSKGIDLGLDLIVIAIQPADDNPRPNVMQAYINAIKSAYLISAIIATGLSRGGQSWNWFALNNEAQLAQITAFVMFSAQGYPTDVAAYPAILNPALFEKYKIPYWFGCGTLDSFYDSMKSMYKAIGAADAALVTWSEWVGAGHGDPVWSDGYNPAWVKNSLGISIYKWAAGLGVAQPQPVPIPVPPPKAISKIVVTYDNGSTVTLFADQKITLP